MKDNFVYIGVFEVTADRQYLPHHANLSSVL